MTKNILWNWIQTSGIGKSPYHSLELDSNQTLSPHAEAIELRYLSISVAVKLPTNHFQKTSGIKHEVVSISKEVLFIFISKMFSQKMLVPSTKNYFTRRVINFGR